MTNIGVEVGQKMRSAIKAKLTELDCYVDDELPDYIMVMIANKRSKSQMRDDLQLFLAAKTATFVDWLHIVLKKLKEVHVTNPDVFKKPAKRKSNEYALSEDELKKVKKEKKEENKALKKAKKEAKSIENLKSLTDDLPITANKISEARKIVVMQENQRAQINAALTAIDEDNFDIPLLSEISASNEEELVLIEKKIKSVKSRLGLQVESEEDEEEDCLNIKADPDDLLINEQLKKTKEDQFANRKITVEEPQLSPQSSHIDLENAIIQEEETKRRIHTRITFDKEKDSLHAKYGAILNSQPKKRSVLDRLGQKSNDNESSKRVQSNITKARTLEDVRQKLKNKMKVRESKESVLNRLGVMSKVSIPIKKPKPVEPEINEDEEESRTVTKEVPSVIKVKPRVLPPRAKQANPKLLLKAVAEAQKSVTQTPNVGHEKQLKAMSKDLKKNKQPIKEQKLKKSIRQRLDTKQIKVVLNNYLNEEETMREKLINKAKIINLQYASPEVAEEKPKVVEKTKQEEPNVNQKFIVTLDGIDKSFPKSKSNDAKSIVKIVRAPSPIIFESSKEAAPKDKPVAPVVSTIKTKERCKYWPNCKQSEKCEFIHPLTPCKMFPNCKFAEKCLYIHPNCKFETSCTRRDCPYNHTGRTSAGPVATKPTVQICKFYPSWCNVNCPYFHPSEPRLCKFGVFCKNKLVCNFIHTQPTKPSNLTWRSDQKSS